MGFEPTIPEFELGKTVHALDRAVTVMGCFSVPCLNSHEGSDARKSVKIISLRAKV
jgi:hypothetical protein